MLILYARGFYVVSTVDSEYVGFQIIGTNY